MTDKNLETHRAGQVDSQKKQDQPIDLVRDGKTIGSFSVYPRSISFKSTNDERKYFAEVDNDRVDFSSLPLKDGDYPDGFQQLLIQKMLEKRAYMAPKNLLGKWYTDKLSDEMIETLRHVSTFKDVLDTVFSSRHSLSVLDIGSGYGEFPLALAQNKKALGIKNIIASELNMYLLQEKEQDLKKVGVSLRQFDAVQPDPHFPKQDVVILNAPQAVGKHAYASEALNTAVTLLKKPGIFVLRRNEASDDIGYQPHIFMSQELPLFQYKDLPDLPRSRYTKNLRGESASVFIGFHLAK